MPRKRRSTILSIRLLLRPDEGDAEGEVRPWTPAMPRGADYENSLYETAVANRWSCRPASVEDDARDIRPPSGKQKRQGAGSRHSEHHDGEEPDRKGISETMSASRRT